MNNLEIDNYPKTYLISIAVSNYIHFSPLPGAINDAEAIISALTPKYKIDSCIEVHEDNFTEQRIKEVFEDLNPSPEDSLIIIYNGHGDLDHNKHFYWIPKKGEKDINASWYLATNIFSEIKNLDIAHVAVIVNCCYSGMMPTQQIDANKAFENKKDISRWLLTGGKRDQSVEDTSVNSKISPFAEEIIEYLKANNDEYKISIAGLWSRVKIRLEERQEYQVPILSPFDKHQGGDFYFHLTEGDEKYWNKVKDKNIIEDYYSYMNQFPNGKYVSKAYKRIDELTNERKDWLETIKKVKTTLLEFNEKSRLIKGNFQQDAVSLLKSLDATSGNLTKEQEREEDWKIIIHSDKIKDFEDFDKKWREGKYIEKSKVNQERLKKELRANQDWDNARKSNTLENKRAKFRTFIHDHPYDSRVGQAKSKEEDIKAFLDASNETNIEKKIFKLKNYKGDYETQAQNILAKLTIEKDATDYEKRIKTAIDSFNLDSLYDIKSEIEGRNEKEKQYLSQIYQKTIAAIEDFNEQLEKDYNKALEKDIESDDLIALTEFIVKYKKNDYVSKAMEYFQNEEQKYYDEFIKEDTIESCEIYLSKFEKFKNKNVVKLYYIIDIKKRKEELLRDKTAFFKANTRLELERYVSDVQTYIYIGKYFLEANESIKNMIKEEEKDKLYQLILESPSISLCEKFILDFSDLEDEKYKQVDKILKFLLMSRLREELYQTILAEENVEKRLKDSRTFLNIYGNEEDKKYIDEVRAIRNNCIFEREDLEAFEKAKNMDSIDDRKEALINYLNRENPRKKKEAEDLITEIDNEIQKDNETFEKAKNAETIEKKIEALNLYLQGSNPKNKDEAEKYLRNLELEKQDIELFEHTNIHNNTIVGWANYIPKSRNDERKNWAIAQRNKLKKEKEEDDYFKIIKAQKTKEGYLKYLETYRNNGGRYIEDVEVLLMELLSSTYFKSKEITKEPIQFLTEKQKRWSVFIIFFFISILISIATFLFILINQFVSLIKHTKNM